MSVINSDKAWLSNREWIFVIIITIISQFLLHQFSSNMMNETQVINYISFSGTIVSLILAILAIIYSFIQTGTQQSSADRIAVNISTLNEISGSVGSSAHKVEAQVEQLNSVVSDIGKLPNEIVLMISDAIGVANKKHVEDINEVINDALAAPHFKAVNSSLYQSEEDGDGDGDGDVITFSILFMTIASCIVLGNISVLKLADDASDLFGDDPKVVQKINVYLSGAEAILSAFVALDVLKREGKSPRERYYCMIRSKSNLNTYSRLISVMSSYYEDAKDDFLDELDQDIAMFFIDYFGFDVNSEIQEVSSEDIEKITRDGK
ncbi:TPA: hypothetical protein ACSP17_002820 [Aeromonas hydrophila]